MVVWCVVWCVVWAKNERISPCVDTMLNTMTVRDAAKDIASRTDVQKLVRSIVNGWQPEERGDKVGTLHGPCPKCGGVNRFYVTALHAACNQCHPQRMDAPGFVSWLTGCNMAEAVRQLDSGLLRAVVSLTPSQPAGQPSAWDEDKALFILGKSATALLAGTQGERGRQYLLSRGLRRATWEAFGLGYTDARRLTKDRDTQWPAIVWPVQHEYTDAVTAVRYRFIGQTPTNDRYDSLRHSSTVGRMFGTIALPEYALLPPDVPERWHLHPEASSCLVLCEGEFNAMSIWQACQGAGVDVLSFCSESQSRFPEWCVDLASRYGVVLTWLDNEKKAVEAAKQIPGALPVRSPGDRQTGQKFDANSMLLRGQLSALIHGMRATVLKKAAQREALLWQLFDAHQIQPLDEMTLELAHWFAKQLNVSWEATDTEE